MKAMIKLRGGKWGGYTDWEEWTGTFKDVPSAVKHLEQNFPNPPDKNCQFGIFGYFMMPRVEVETQGYRVKPQRKGFWKLIATVEKEKGE